MDADRFEITPLPRRVVCGWCPTPLPDGMAEWDHHFLVVHNYGGGSSVRFYYDDDPLEALL